MIESVTHHGRLIDDVPLPGETRENEVAPAHPNGIQLSRNRVLLLFSTRSYRGRDDERSACYQLRADHWGGKILATGFLSQTRDDWDPMNDGSKHVLQHGHPTAFGLPKGALINGKRQPHENIFVAMWRICARQFDPETGLLFWEAKHPELTRATRDAEWLHFRLNDAEDDIEIIEPKRPLRQLGYEDGPERCEQPVKSFIKGFVPPVAFNDECDEWIDINTAAGADSQTGKGFVMPAKYKFNRETKQYEWVQSAPLIGPNLFEAGFARYKDGFVGCSRQIAGKTGLKPEEGEASTVNWWRTDDPFNGKEPEIIRPLDQVNYHPLSVFSGADGGIKRLGGCIDISPHKSGRAPTYILDIDPDDGFKVLRRNVVLDSDDPKCPPIRPRPYIGFTKLLTHLGGSEQAIAHRIWSPWSPDPDRRAQGKEEVTPEEIRMSGIYWATAKYTEEHPPQWDFQD